MEGYTLYRDRSRKLKEQMDEGRVQVGDERYMWESTPAAGTSI